MKANKLLFIVTIFTFSLLSINHPALAESKNLKKAKKELKTILANEKKLKTHYSALTPSEKTSLLESQSSELTDSDSDGVSNAIEDASDDQDSCNGDSDGDGVSDGAERENKGSITAADSSSFTVKSILWTFNGATQYEDGSAAGLVVGACVEVKGRLIGTSFIATKVEFKDSGDCSSGSHH